MSLIHAMIAAYLALHPAPRKAVRRPPPPPAPLVCEDDEGEECIGGEDEDGEECECDE